MKINFRNYLKSNDRKILTNLLRALMLYLMTMLNANSSTSLSSSIGHYRNDQTEQFFNKIMYINNDNNNGKAALKTGNEDLNKKIAFFLSQLTTTLPENTCSSKMLQSNIQSKMRILKSIISTCSGYCRLAMDQYGDAYGSKDFNLDTIWKRVEVNDLNNKALLGAYYIKFIMANKYLCINNDGKLYSSLYEHVECLWLNNLPRLISAIYPNVNVVINNNCSLNTKSKSRFQINDIMKNSFDTINIENEICSNSISITSGYSPDLQKYFRNCQITLMQKPNNQQQNETKIEVNPLYDIKGFFNFNPKNNNINNKPQTDFSTKIKINNINQSSSDQIESEKTSNRRFKKCYKFRKTPHYKKCMRKYYKCYQFNNNPDKLRKCRKKFGITAMPIRNKKPINDFHFLYAEK